MKIFYSGSVKRWVICRIYLTFCHWAKWEQNSKFRNWHNVSPYPVILSSSKWRVLFRIFPRSKLYGKLNRPLSETQTGGWACHWAQCRFYYFREHTSGFGPKKLFIFKYTAWTDNCKKMATDFVALQRQRVKNGSRAVAITPRAWRMSWVWWFSTLSLTVAVRFRPCGGIWCRRIKNGSVGLLRSSYFDPWGHSWVVKTKWSSSFHSAYLVGGCTLEPWRGAHLQRSPLTSVKLDLSE